MLSPFTFSHIANRPPVINATRRPLTVWPRRSCSGAYSAAVACWKTVDGKILFVQFSQGWDGSVVPGTDLEFLEFDRGAGAAAVDTVGVFSVGPSDDEHFPVHNPQDVALLSRTDASGQWTSVVETTCPAAENCTLSFPKTTTRCVPPHSPRLLGVCESFAFYLSSSTGRPVFNFPPLLHRRSVF